MKLKFRQIKIPTLVGLLVLLVGVAAGVYFVQQSSSWLLRASPESKPKQVKLTNITDNSFVVSWITDEATTGFLRYSINNSFDQLAEDDRDQLSNKVTNFKSHHVTVKGLAPTTDYFFKIGSGKRGPITEKIQKRYFDYVNGRCDDIYHWHDFIK